MSARGRSRRWGRGLLAAASLATAALLVPGRARAYSTLSGVTIARSFAPATAKPGSKVTVTLEVAVGSIGSDPLRGFYLAEQVPDALAPSSGSATLAGQPLTVISETAGAALYTGCTTIRWVLEEPPAWSQNKPLAASQTLAVSYEVTIPSGVTSPPSFPGASWVGMIPSLGDAGDHFGHEDGPTGLPVEQPPAIALDPTLLSFEVEEGAGAPASQGVAVSNAGGGELGPVGTEVTYGPGGAGWLKITPGGTGNAQTLDSAADPAGLAANTYSATVKVSAAGAANSPQSYTVSFTVTAKPSTTEPTIALAPRSLVFAAEAGGADPPVQQVAVSNTGVDRLAAVQTAVSYVNGDGWLSVTSAGEGNAQSLSNIVSCAGLAPDTYTATVQVSAAGASNSPQNYTVSLTVTGAPPGGDGGLAGDGGIGGRDAGPGGGDGGHSVSFSGDKLLGGCTLAARPRVVEPALLPWLLLLGAALPLRRRRR